MKRIAARIERVFQTGGIRLWLVNLDSKLWSAGFRPTGAQHPSDVINAKDAHLADLRKALFEGVVRGGK